MKTLEDHLSQYARYHRDPRNIASHFPGILLIVLAVAILLSRPVFSLAGWPLSPAVPLAGAVVLFYLRLDRPLGLLMSVLLGLALWLGAALAAQATGVWLTWGLGLFLVGWAIQFVGHHYEGRKPAFLDDLAGLAIGPLFIATEAVFLMGGRPDLRRTIEERAGPVRRRQPSR
ncbi:Mpo1-like protein [uncultured Pseudomonas sp.]|uniref:Mpo1 family 2-hydroxy fatty acid dioxygenase n=1 Tax=uncultured Pseudomonas sp. TaxID=114707 RepID=UPI002601540D|nr:Mpo1-like protein [uncultured Pseudomonas sp.]